MGKGRTPETAKIAARSPLQGAEDFRRCSIRSNPHRGRYTSPALTAASPPLCGLAGRKHLALQAVSVQQVSYHPVVLLPVWIER